MAPSQAILVIDDEPDILLAIQLILQRAGYRVLTADDGETGIDCALRERPNLVLADLMMPRSSGFVVLERLKEHFGQDYAVIMMTGNSADAHRAYAEFLGVSDYLLKPIVTEQLLASVRRLLPILTTEPALTADGSVPQAGVLPFPG